MSEILKTISGLELFHPLGLVVVLAGFMFVLFRIWHMSREHSEYMSALPLDGTDNHREAGE